MGTAFSTEPLLTALFVLASLWVEKPENGFLDPEDSVVAHGKVHGI